MWGDELNGLTMLQEEPMASNLIIGNNIAKYNEDIDKWTIYRIISTDEAIDEQSGKHTISADAVNLAIWRLGKTIPAKKHINECNIKVALEWIMAGTGWTLVNNSESGLLAEMSFDGTSTSQSYLQQILTTYDSEANAYVHFDASGLVDDLILEITDHLGSDEADKTIRYGKNLKGVHRKTVDTTLITKLYIYSSSGGTIQKVNKGKNFITDVQANALYNTDDNTWLEGSITSNSIRQPSALMEWGQRQLRLFNHPRINYTVDVSSDFEANLGDEVKIIDTEMTPELTVQARVIQKSESLSNPFSNTLTLGEFATVRIVTPSFISSMESRWNSKVQDLFEKARKDMNASTVNLITPLGRSWYNDDKTKKVIARLFIEGNNVTSYLKPSSFTWQYIQQDGTHDLNWEHEHEDDGYVVEIQPPFVGTLLCSVNDEHVSEQAEIWINTDRNNKDGTFKQLWKSHYNTNYWGDTNYGALQCSYLKSNGEVISSYAYKGKNGTRNGIVDTEFIRYNSNGDLLDSMIISGGGHGSSFSYNESENALYTVCQDLASKDWYIGAINYEPNTKRSLVQFNWSCKIDKFVRPSFDFEHGYMLGSNMDGTYLICEISDLKEGNFRAMVQGRLQDFGINPSDSHGSKDGTTNTMQSNGIYYPFGFFTFGDVNNKDAKQILCVNLITQSKEFIFPIMEAEDIHLEVPIEQGGHLEPEGIYYDKPNKRLMVGFNISEWLDEKHYNIKPISSIYSFPIDMRDDTEDLARKYPIDDANVPLPTDDPYNPSDDGSDEISDEAEVVTQETNTVMDQLSDPDSKLNKNINAMVDPVVPNVLPESYNYVNKIKTQSQIAFENKMNKMQNYADKLTEAKKIKKRKNKK